MQWMTVKQIADDPNYPFTRAMLCYYLLHRHKNGLQTAVRKVGRKLILRKDLFDAWIESQSET